MQPRCSRGRHTCSTIASALPSSYLRPLAESEPPPARPPARRAQAAASPSSGAAGGGCPRCRSRRRTAVPSPSRSRCPRGAPPPPTGGRRTTRWELEPRCGRDTAAIWPTEEVDEALHTRRASRLQCRGAPACLMTRRSAAPRKRWRRSSRYYPSLRWRHCTPSTSEHSSKCLISTRRRRATRTQS